LKVIGGETDRHQSTSAMTVVITGLWRKQRRVKEKMGARSQRTPFRKKGEGDPSSLHGNIDIAPLGKTSRRTLQRENDPMQKRRRDAERVWKKEKKRCGTVKEPGSGLPGVVYP